MKRTGTMTDEQRINALDELTFFPGLEYAKRQPKIVTFDILVTPLLERAQQLIGTTVAVDVPKSSENRRLTSTPGKINITIK